MHLLNLNIIEYLLLSYIYAIVNNILLFKKRNIHFYQKGEFYMLQGFIIAFSIYSKIPMPKIKQNQNNMKYAIAFFPFIGLAIAACTGIWLYFAPIFHFSRLFISIVALILPFLITGNIHFHGFLNTINALSCQEKEKKSDILKDSPITSLSCIGAVLYFLFSAAIWNDLYPFFTTNTENDMAVICLIMITYIMSRCFSGLIMVTFPKATIGSFDFDSTQLKFCKIFLLLILFISCLLEFFLQPMFSGIILAAGVIFYFYYRLMAMKNFGGITDNLNGWFLQNCELLFLTVILIGCKIYY